MHHLRLFNFVRMRSAMTAEIYLGCSQHQYMQYLKNKANIPMKKDRCDKENKKEGPENEMYFDGTIDRHTM